MRYAPPTAGRRTSAPCLFRRAEHDLEAADRDAVAVVEHLLGDASAVHVRAVGALKVIEGVAAEAKADLGVLARDAAVVEHDVVRWMAPDQDRVRAERHGRAVPLLERGLRGARPLAQQGIAVEHHGGPRLDRAELLRVGLDLVAGRVDERARDADVAGRQVVLALDLDGGIRKKRVAALPCRGEERLPEAALEAAAVLLELRVVGRRQRHDIRIRHEGLREADGLMGFHRADDALLDLDGLQLRAEEARRPALDDAAHERFDPLHYAVLTTLIFKISAPTRMMTAVRYTHVSSPAAKAMGP